MLNKKFSQT